MISKEYFCEEQFTAPFGVLFFVGGNMGIMQWLGIRPRDDPSVPKVTDNIRDSGQTFVFGRAR